ncbi:MAG: hypothetical protein ACK4HS_08390 [Acinetobacter junii]
MIKGLAITPPVLGRISIGKIVEKNGKRLPEKDDQFTITSQINVILGLGVLWMLRHRIKLPLKVFAKKNRQVNNAQWLFEAIEYPIKFLD